ncbi:copper homeostasis protein CutC [Belliella aquatica]|uniref:PF03932 family protein CutC n=1 Tax=Belliella aquatica TaxID=1323734 RepID=A0ABQ1M2K5_9BACT|nr:copper homeostasis protein CutC [Belliella aquatica]MCH7404845.1 copper homeostasis protein CutC [Belliella aquatica]GGC33770.1 copper homeostasis protein CutC [Belliella aquatica]
MKKILLEAPVFTIEAALLADRFGVDRIELCSDFGEGGETPSVGALAYLKAMIKIPIFVMVRPRGGDFVYSEEEVEVMRRDIQILNSYGADGFVFGVLDESGNVDQKACEVLVKEAGDKPCTFHRAFDVCSDPSIALEKIIACGFKRILTSGTRNSVSEGLSIILDLLDRAKDRIIIMPGGGLQPSHIERLKSSNQLLEVHASCKGYRNTKSTYQSKKVTLSKDPQAFNTVLTLDENIVAEFNKVLMVK